MSQPNRSRDTMFQTRSLKNKSIQTKQQSVSRLSPKGKKTSITVQSQSKGKKKGKTKNNAIKSISKLNDCFNRMVNKLSNLEDYSNIITLKSSTIASKSEQNINNKVKYEQETSCNNSTQVLAHKVQKQAQIIRHNKSKQQREVENDPKQLEIQQQSSTYTKIFDSALAIPHCLHTLSISPKSVNMKTKSRRQKSIKLLQQVQQYKKQQNSNWAHINTKIGQYISMDQQTKRRNNANVSNMLLKQGIQNYRWVQIMNKMHISDYEQVIQQQQRKKLKKLKQQWEVSSNSNDAPLQQIFLKNYEWQQTSWNNEQQKEQADQSSSQLQYKSQQSSEVGYKIDPAELIQQTMQIQDNVDLIMNWLIDEFVVQLADKLDSNLLATVCPPLNIKNQEQIERSSQAEDYAVFLASVTQICDDCNDIRELDIVQNPSVILLTAVTETQKQDPTLTRDQAKQKLIKSICNRELEHTQLYLPEQHEDEQIMKLDFIYELQEYIWQAIVMGQACKLWMGLT